ncbi:MAG: YncE family protein [Phycisphaerales bacterium]|nr:YncE family protein [Phycisphaerales bacterium]
MRTSSFRHRAAATIVVAGANLGLTAFALAQNAQDVANRAGAQQPIRIPFSQDSGRGSLGHPLGTFTGVAPPPAGGIDPQPVDPSPLPTVAPLASGPFVNFESPMVKPLAVNAAGTRLFVADTPANLLVTYDITPGAAASMRMIGAIPVGLDPVSVAIQPGTGDRFVWVANHISDDVSVVDTQTGTISRTVNVGDEPVNILFSADGAYAWVVLQGPHALAAPPFNQFSSLVTIETATGAMVGALDLDANTARAAAFDAAEQKLIVAALHSGNNTTQVFDPMFVQTGVDPDGAPTGLSAPSTLIVQMFPPTAALFAGDGLMSPYPDLADIPNPAPLVARIIPDGAKLSVWSQIVDLLSLPDGTPDPAMVAAMQTFGIVNATTVLQRIIDDAKDTVDHDLIVLDVSNPRSPVIDRHIGDIGTTIRGLTIQPGTRRIYLTNMEPRNTTRLVTNLRGRFMEHQLVTIDDYLAPAPSITRTNLNADIPGFDDLSAHNPGAHAASLSDPTDIVFTPDARLVFFAALSSDRIGWIDTFLDFAPVERIDVGRGPRALAYDAAGRRLFVLNRTDMTISQIAVNGDPADAVEATRALFNPEPGAVRNGRNFLFSAKFSNNAGQSCSSCHIDGGLDHLAWDLGNPHAAMAPSPSNTCPGNSSVGCEVSHPLKGPMVTQSLRGLSGRNPFHWRGDKPQFTDFNEAFDNLLGGSEIPVGDMIKFDQFVKAMVYPPNPFWERDNAPKDPDAPAGFDHFLTPNGPGAINAGTCQNCHQMQNDGAGRQPGFLDDAGVDESAFFMQVQEITQLRGIYKKFPSDKYNGFGLIHDGREESEANGHPLQTFLKTFFRNMNAQGRQETIAMVTAFPTNVTNIVGWQVRIRGNATPQQLANINTMIAQHHPASLNLGAPWPPQPDPQPSRCDVVAHGLIEGTMRGFVYDHAASLLAGTPTFRSDLDQRLTLAELLAQAASGTMTFMAVPPGSGPRIGIDSDLDCQSNRLDPFPYSSADFNASGAVSVQDIFDFLAAYFAGRPDADFNWSATISVQDLFDFLAEYFKGGC